MATTATGRTFRLFISSTFSDFIAEREALHSEVYPELSVEIEAHDSRRLTFAGASMKPQ